MLNGIFFIVMINSSIITGGRIGKNMIILNTAFSVLICFNFKDTFFLKDLRIEIKELII